MKQMLLIYWTGTGNTTYITNLVKEQFINDYQITTLEININSPRIIHVFDYDLVGIGYPIYGFNVPGFFEKYIKRQKWNPHTQFFIYKNSGETLHANDASSYKLVNFFKRKNIKVLNEYHFIMPYNIHFRFEDNLIKEMLEINNKLVKILHYEVMNNIANIKKYKAIHKFITFNVALVHIGGNVNSFLYHIDNKKCIKCNKCINECPMNNIYLAKNGRIKFHHHCQMCMRCSFYCPTNAFHIGFVEGWKVNGKYDFEKIKTIENDQPVITKDTKGFFACYIETYEYVNNRYKELFLKENDE